MSWKRKVTPAQVERIVELREAGVKMAAIAAEVGLPLSTCNWWVTREGAVPPKGRRFLAAPKAEYIRNGQVVRAFTSEEDELIQKLSIQGLTLSQIAREVGRGRNSVIGRLNALALRDATLEGGDA